MPRILILHATVGMGHLRAATALARAFEQHTHATVRVEDTLEHARELFSRIYAGLYLGIADRVPSFWSSFYDRTDRPPTRFDIVANVRALSTAAGVHRLPALLDTTRPDAIIATHFLPLEVLGPLRQQGLVPPLYCIVTDYRAHHFWACPGVDGYFVPTHETAAQLQAAGVPRAQVHVTGIPIDPAIATPLPPAIARLALDLPVEQPVVLLNGSGMAIPRVRAIAEELLAHSMTGTLIVAAGRNRELVAALADLRSTSATELRVLGQQPSLDPLIAASDLVVGKAGGLTVSEVLGRGVPLIIPTPVPGQEQANADHVMYSGAGLCRSTAEGVAEAVLMLLADPARRYRMATAARLASHPAAAATIASHVLADVQRAYQPIRPLSSALALA